MERRANSGKRAPAHSKGTAAWSYGEILIMVIMLLLFMLLLTSALSAFTGNEYGTVKLNAEILRSKISEACSLGRADIQQLSLPQPTPYPTQAHRLFDIPGFLPRAYIKISGDPKYILYFEAFPAGEATGWETYHDFDYRVIAPFSYSKKSGNRDEKGTQINPIDFEKYLYKGAGEKSFVDDVAEAARKAGVEPSKQTGLISVLVNNIILTDKLNPVPNEEPRPFSGVKISRSGDWKEKTAGSEGPVVFSGDNTFEFSSYNLLTKLEQTSLKYRSCGKNFLCMKTQDGVERLELPKDCGNKPLEYIQLEYDNRAIGTVGIGALAVGACAAVTKGVCITIPLSVVGGITSFISSIPILRGIAAAYTAKYLGENVLGPLFRAFLAYKSSDFYLVSPCVLKNARIERLDCSQIDCKKWIKYPLYDVVPEKDGKWKYENKGYHYQCLDSTGNSDSASTDRNAAPAGACLKVVVSGSPDGFCWTADPTKKISKGFFSAIANLGDAQTQLLASILGFTPVKDSTLYIQNPPAIALLPTKGLEVSLSAVTKFIEKRYAWGWPGGALPANVQAGG